MQLSESHAPNWQLELQLTAKLIVELDEQLSFRLEVALLGTLDEEADLHLVIVPLLHLLSSISHFSLVGENQE